MTTRTIPWSAEALIFNAHDAIFGQTLEGTITSWNRGAEHIFGYAPDEVIGQPVAILDAYPRMQEWRATAERLRRGEWLPLQREELRHKDGRSFAVTIAVSPIIVDGVLIGASRIVRPITIRMDEDSRLAEAMLEREQLRRQLLHLSRLATMGQMSTVLAHELQQPLTAIVAYVGSARRMLRSDEIEGHEHLATAMDHAAAQANRTAQLIRKLRFFLSDHSVDRELLGISEVIADVSDLISFIARQADVKITLHMEENAMVRVDRVQIQQVLLNLMRNAIEAMIGERRRELEVATTRNDQHVIVAVTDTGPGISSEIVARLFQPFVTSKAEGMGIGLSICQMIVAAHDGELWLQSSSKEGTAFCLKLPIHGYGADRATVEDAW